MDNTTQTNSDNQQIFIEFDSNFWDAYFSVLDQAVKILNSMTGANVELSRTLQHLGGMKDPATGLYYREYFHLRYQDQEFTVPISLYTPEHLALWFAEKLGIRVPPKPVASVEMPQPVNPLGTYLGEDFYAPAAGDKRQIGETYRPEGADYQFRKIRRNPFDVRGTWKKEPLPVDQAA